MAKQKPMSNVKLCVGIKRQETNKLQIGKLQRILTNSKKITNKKTKNYFIKKIIIKKDKIEVI